MLARVIWLLAAFAACGRDGTGGAAGSGGGAISGMDTLFCAPSTTCSQCYVDRCAAECGACADSTSCRMARDEWLACAERARAASMPDTTCLVALSRDAPALALYRCIAAGLEACRGADGCTSSRPL